MKSFRNYLGQKTSAILRKAAHRLYDYILSSPFEALARKRLYPSKGRRRRAKEELGKTIPELRELARDQERNNPYSLRYLDIVGVNVIGRDGIRLKAAFTAERSGRLLEKTNAELENKFWEWGKRGVCEASGRFSFVKCQELVLRAMKRDGDIFVRFLRGWEGNPFGFAIQLIMPDRVDSELNKTLSGGRKIVMGIEVDEYGRRLAYYVKDEGASEVYPGHKARRIPADEMIQVADPMSPDEERGYTRFSTVFNKLRMLHGADEAELVARRVTSSKMGWLEKVDDDGRAAEESEHDEEPFEEFEAEAGVIRELPPGYKATVSDFGQFDGDPEAFRKGQLRATAAGLGVNYNDLAMDFQGVNYTSLRASYLSDRDGFSVLQRVMIENFVQPIYEEWLKCCVLKGMLKYVTGQDIQKFLVPSWACRGWKWVDPYKEAKGYELLLQHNLISEDEIVSERGADLEEVYLKRLAAKKLRERLGLTDIEEAAGAKDGTTNDGAKGRSGAAAKANTREDFPA